MRRLLSLLPMLVLAGGATIAGAAMPGAAMADGITLEFQHAEIIRLAKPAKTVIIGDPFVADLTLEDPKTIVLFGKQPGITNMVVFDQDSNMLLNWPVTVNDATENRVSVISPGEKRVYEAVWMCGNNNRCIRIPGASDLEKFTYNATEAKDTTTSSSGNNNNKSGSGSDGGTGNSDGSSDGSGTGGDGGSGSGSSNSDQPPPAN